MIYQNLVHIILTQMAPHNAMLEQCILFVSAIWYWHPSWTVRLVKTKCHSLYIYMYHSLSLTALSLYLALPLALYVLSKKTFRNFLSRLLTEGSYYFEKKSDIFFIFQVVCCFFLSVFPFIVCASWLPFTIGLGDQGWFVEYNSLCFRIYFWMIWL